MKKLALIISFIGMGLVNVGFASTNIVDDRDFSLRFLCINAPNKNIAFRCSKSNPKEDVVFFEAYVDDGERLYDFFSRAPLPMRACLNMVYESNKILNRTSHVVLLGQKKMPGYLVEQKDWSNGLLKKYRGKVHALSFFSQISNGKSCNCWFEGCGCLPTKDGITVDIIRNYEE